MATYSRVSGPKQCEGFSLDHQDDSLKNFCQSQGYVLLKKHIYREEGVSGAKKSRPALDKLMEAAKNKEFDIVLVYKIDRFTRSLDDFLLQIKELKSYGIEFKSMTEPIDTSTAIGEAMIKIIAIFAELERKMIRERTIIGQIKYRKQGYWYGSIPPYGYNYNKETHKLEINEKEAKWVKKIYNWLVMDKMSSYKIQDKLNNLRVPTKYDNIGKKKKINGKGFWKKRTVTRILENEVYSGKFTYCKHKYLGRVKGEDNLRPKEDWITIKTPVIIPKELFLAAQKQLKNNERYCQRKAKKDYLFQGMLKCGSCGGRYGCSNEKTPTRQRVRYTCYNTRKWIRDDVCKESSIDESLLEPPIWEEICKLLSNPKLAYQELEKIKNKTDEVKKAKEELGELKQEKPKRNLKKKKLLDLYLSNDVPKEVYLKNYQR